MFNTTYDKVICLTLERRKDRQKAFQRQADEIGLDFSYFYAIEHPNPLTSFNISQYELLKQAYGEGHEKILVLEDDCQFTNLGHYNAIHSQLPMDFKMVYYGANVRPYDNHIEPMPFSPNLRLIRSAFTTHAIGWSSSILESVLSLYDPYRGMVFDAWLDQCLLKSIDAHICVPFLAVQRPSESDLWNRAVDYTDTFAASEEYLKQIV
jgi:hypothetical protein